MAANEIHQYDVGTIFRVTLMDGTVAADVSGATAKSIIFSKPSGTVVEKDAAFYVDGSDGIIQYTTVTDDLDETGTWKIQARVTLATGTWSSDTQKFKVYPNLD